MLDPAIDRNVIVAGVLGGAHVRRCGSSSHIRFLAVAQIRRLPRAHEGPGQRPGGRLRGQRSQRHHSGDGDKVVLRSHNRLVPYVHVYTCVKTKYIEHSLGCHCCILLFFLYYSKIPMRIVVTGRFVRFFWAGGLIHSCV